MAPKTEVFLFIHMDRGYAEVPDGRMYGYALNPVGIKLGASVVPSLTNAWNNYATGPMTWQVTEGSLNGRKLIYQFGATPAAYSSTPTSVGVWGPGSNGVPTNLQKVKDGLHKVHVDFPNKFESFIIWNEMQTPEYWNGTGLQAKQVQQVAHEQIKLDNPNALVCSFPIGAQSQKWIDFMDAGGWQYADAIGIMNDKSFPSREGFIQYVKAKMAAVGCTLPIWDVECNIGMLEATPLPQMDYWRQFRYMMDALTLNTELGVTRTILWSSGQSTKGINLAPGAIKALNVFRDNA